MTRVLETYCAVDVAASTMTCRCCGVAPGVGGNVIDRIGCGGGRVDDDVAHELSVEEVFQAEILIDVGEFSTTTLNTLLCLANALVERSRTTGVPVYFRT